MAIVSILAFGLVGGFFVAKFGVLPGTEWLAIVMMLGIAAISYGAVIGTSWYRWLLFLLCSGLLAVGFEYLGIHTCFPYGCFVYGDVLGAKLWDTVPWTVFVWWTPLIIWIYAILRKYLQSRWLIIVIWAVLLTLIDMVLDPGAVLLGFWAFDAGGWYYNIPRSNFLGRLVSGLVGMAVASILLARGKTTVQRSYSAALTLSFFTAIAAFSGMWIPAVLWWLLLGGYMCYIYNE